MNRKSFVPYIVILLLLPSCAVLPVEEEALPPPVIKSYERAVYKFAVAQKGTLVLYKDVSANYMPALQESLSFSIGDVLIEHVYAKMGQSVKKGQVLAELEKKGIEKNLEENLYALSLADMQVRQLDENFALDRQAAILSQDAAFIAQYDKVRNDLQSQQQILAVRIQDNRDQLEGRTLRAGMDGVVTSVRRTEEGDRSVEAETFIRIADKSLSVFAATGEEYAYFNIGEEVQIKVSSEYYDAVCVSPEELGILEPKDRTVYFRLTDVTASLKENAYGTIRKELDRREDVIHIPQKALRSANGVSFVYMMEDNVRVRRDVEIGMEAEAKVEIISGLKEGEQVITED